MKKLFLIIMLVGLMNFSYAISFDNGATGGTVSVPGDYASLLLAATAFNGLSGGINANWTLEITDDLTEADNVSFSNATNGKTLTIKPQAGKNPVVTFASTTAAGIYGHLVFGIKQVTADPVDTDYNETTNGYVIDGNNGGVAGERNLTLTSNASSATGRVITIFGNQNGVIIKNCKIIQADTAGTSWCIRWAGGSIGAFSNIGANGGRVENCELTATANPAGVGISFSPVANGTEIAAGSCFNNMEFINNDITAGQRGIFCDSVGNTTISGNKITLTGRTGYQTIGLYHWDSNNFAGYTINIKDNIFDLTSPNATAGQGAWGILIDSMTDTSNSGTVNISNNIIKNFAFTNTAAVDQIYRGIVLSRPGATYNVEHNSINIPAADMVDGTTAGYVSAFVVLSTATTAPVSLKNNIIKFAESGTGAAAIYTTAGVLTAAGNDIVSTAGAPFGNINTTPYADFAAWQAAGYDATATGGQSVDPATTTPAWDAGLKFNTYGIPSPLIGVASSSVLTDIDGEARPATGATPGADEPLVGAPPTPTPIPSPTPFATNATTNWGLYR